MSGTPIRWDPEPTAVGADPAATLALPASAWEAIGAAFDEVDDGQGETPRLATGTADAGDRALPFGVLDYGEENTYLLVPGDADQQRAALGRLLPALEEAGLPDVAEALVDLVRDTPATLEERIADLERRLEELTEQTAPSARASKTIAPARSGAAASGAGAFPAAAVKRWLSRSAAGGSDPVLGFVVIDASGGRHFYLRQSSGFSGVDRIRTGNEPIKGGIVYSSPDDLLESGGIEGFEIIARSDEETQATSPPKRPTRGRRKKS